MDLDEKTHRNWVETRQNCLVLSAVVFTLLTLTRQSCVVRVGGVNKLLYESDSNVVQVLPFCHIPSVYQVSLKSVYQLLKSKQINKQID